MAITLNPRTAEVFTFLVNTGSGESEYQIAAETQAQARAELDSILSALGVSASVQEGHRA